MIERYAEDIIAGNGKIKDRVDKYRALIEEYYNCFKKKWPEISETQVAAYCIYELSTCEYELLKMINEGKSLERIIADIKDGGKLEYETEWGTATLKLPAVLTQALDNCIKEKTGLELGIKQINRLFVTYLFESEGITSETIERYLILS